MNLTTTNRIKRRNIDIVPDPNQEFTNCSITLVNWLYNQDLNNKRLKISEFYLNNSSIACFIPEYPTSMPQASQLNDKTGLGINTIVNNTFDKNSLNYFVNIHNSATKDNYCMAVRMDPNYSDYSLLQPSIFPQTSYAMYSNRYFWFFNTKRF